MPYQMQIVKNGIQQKTYRIRYELLCEQIYHPTVDNSDIVNIGLHFILKNVRPYAASCSEA